MGVVVQDALAELIVGVINGSNPAVSADPFTTLFGGSGSDMKCYDSTKREQLHQNNIWVQPQGLIPIKRIATSGRSAFLFNISMQVFDHVNLLNSISTAQAGIDNRIRPDNPNYTAVVSVLKASLGSDVLGFGIYISMSDAEVVLFEDGENALVSGDPARAEINYLLTVTLDHSIPLSLS